MPYHRLIPKEPRSCPRFVTTEMRGSVVYGRRKSAPGCAPRLPIGSGARRENVVFGTMFEQQASKQGLTRQVPRSSSNPHRPRRESITDPAKRRSYRFRVYSARNTGDSTGSARCVRCRHRPPVRPSCLLVGELRERRLPCHVNGSMHGCEFLRESAPCFSRPCALWVR